MCSFLGSTNHYRHFIYKYVHIAHPLNSSLLVRMNPRKDKKVEGTDEYEESFRKLKELCSSTPVIEYAIFFKTFKLHTSVCGLGPEVMLYQKQDDGTDRVNAYASRILSKSDRNYLAHKLEFLAPKLAITNRFHKYLHVGTFDVLTNDIPSMYNLIWAKLGAVNQCWITSLANYNFEIHYKTGNSDVEADVLSCIPWDRTVCKTSDNCTIKAIMSGCCCKAALFKPFIGYLSTSHKV